MHKFMADTSLMILYFYPFSAFCAFSVRFLYESGFPLLEKWEGDANYAGELCIQGGSNKYIKKDDSLL